MTSAVELWNTTEPAPTHVANINTDGQLPINTGAMLTIGMNVLLTPQGYATLNASLGSEHPVQYEIRFPDGITCQLHGHLLQIDTGPDGADLTWKAFVTAPDPGPHNADPAPQPSTAPTSAEQCMANAARLLHWAEDEMDLAKMNQYNELAQTWINLASLHQTEPN